MLNTEHAYHDAGYRAGRARRQGDEMLARHWSQWFRQALLIERDADRSEARRLFDQGYLEGRGL